jgi:hypothetical protein
MYSPVLLYWQALICDPVASETTWSSWIGRFKVEAWEPFLGVEDEAVEGIIGEVKMEEYSRAT